MKPKEYHIDSFEKLVNIVNKDNLEALSVDLVLWLSYHVQIMEGLREAHPEITKDKSNWELSPCTFVWIDDGKHDFKSVTIKNGLTGEVRTFKVKEK